MKIVKLLEEGEMTSDRLCAYLRLLAQPDETDLRGRGAHLTQRGARGRFTRTWQPAARVWIARRLSQAQEIADGWPLASRAGAHILTLRKRND